MLDLTELCSRMARRDVPRTEADVQADIRTLLLTAAFDLADQQVNLEAPASDRRRIDVEIGFCVIEVKKDLRNIGIRTDGIAQLAGYVKDRTVTLQQRYVGILTDGAEWRLFHLANGELVQVSIHEVDTNRPNVEALTIWLEGVLATAHNVTPTPTEIERRLGAGSASYALDFASLLELYQANRAHPNVTLKRQLWAKLLTTALGTNFEDSDELFVNHSLLVATGELIAHGVLGEQLTNHTAEMLLSGTLFRNNQVLGVVEPDFFDWPLDVPNGSAFVTALARRIARFKWADVEHDVMKTLYESVINTDQRKRLGEYYTPDWLAEKVVTDTVPEPLKTRVLDPACGSGTFLFHAVRRYLRAAHDAGRTTAEALAGVTTAVIGVDVHPVAVALARVTYLLALDFDGALNSDNRPPLAVPVYLGDALQWTRTADQELFSSDVLRVSTRTSSDLAAEGALQLDGFETDLQFPESLLLNAATFDGLVSDLARMASERAPGTAVPSIKGVLRRHAVADQHTQMVTATFKRMCELHDQGRDHIWGYYVRNLVRPVWLGLPDNRVDALVGNPPWLAYRFMTPSMQQAFRTISTNLGLWQGASVATNQDLSALFVARCIELYLRVNGRFGFVMPLNTLTRRQYEGFRTGTFNSANTSSATVAYDQAWDLGDIKPAFFPVKASVIRGSRTATHATKLPAQSVRWKGKLKQPAHSLNWTQASKSLTSTESTLAVAVDAPRSPYHDRFSQGATIVPRVLFYVERATQTGKLGPGSGRTSVTSARTKLEKAPWRNVTTRTGTIETGCIFRVLDGQSLVPFKIREPHEAILPWNGKRFLEDTDPDLDMLPGLAQWWRTANDTWRQLRSSDRLSLLDQLDYRSKLSDQLPIVGQRVVYTKAGMYLAAARVADQAAVIDHKLYWAAASSDEEALYLVAVLNAPVTTLAVRPLQARGQHNPRDFDKYPFQLPIPAYDPANPDHAALVELAREAEQIVGSLALSATRKFESVRSDIRSALEEAGINERLDGLAGPLVQATS
jgi:SAM-dependent methyltransferase